MRKIVLLGLLLPFVIATARASSFTVNPVWLQLSAAQPTAVLHVKNNGKTPIVVQLSLFAWSQANGKNVLTPTRKLLATPPIFTLPEDGEQIVRVGLLAKPAAQRETAYRLFMTQVPPRPRPGFRGLQVALRMSLPVFVAPRIGIATPKLAWRIRRLGNGKVSLTVTNNGTAHAQVSDLSLAVSATGSPLAQPATGNGYVLPGTSRSWEFKLKSRVKHGQMWVLRGKSRQGSFSERLGPGQ
jgi:fimbrial chaperone protein